MPTHVLRSNTHRTAPLIASILCGALSACTAAYDFGGQTTADYASPQRSLTICSGYGCIIKDKLTFSDPVLKDLTVIMDRGKGSAAKERDALYKAIGYMETAARNKLKYRPDIEYSYQKNAGKRGQMDCVDESLNTLTFLKYLKHHGLLRYHTPLRHYAERGLLVDGRYPHKSARMLDDSGSSWAVDSWKGPNGARPQIIRLSQWYEERNSASQY